MNNDSQLQTNYNTYMILICKKNWKLLDLKLIITMSSNLTIWMLLLFPSLYFLYEIEKMYKSYYKPPSPSLDLSASPKIVWTVNILERTTTFFRNRMYSHPDKTV